MSAEFLPKLPEIYTIITLYPIFFVAVGSGLKRLLKDQRPDVPPGDLEIHHKNPIYKGGNGDRDNLVALTRPEHAKTHHDAAMEAPDWNTASAEYWAVSAITKRMSKAELEELNRLIKKKK
jgi:hypothetical protein